MHRRSLLAPAADVRRNPHLPGLDRGGRKLGIGITDDRGAAANDAIRTGSLKREVAQQFCDTGGALARAKRSADTAKQRIAADELRRNWPRWIPGEVDRLLDLFDGCFHCVTIA